MVAFNNRLAKFKYQLSGARMSPLQHTSGSIMIKWLKAKKDQYLQDRKKVPIRGQ